MKDIVLACHVYIDDGWYGNNQRVLLSKEDGVGFTSKTEAKKYIVKLRKYVTEMYSNQDKVQPLTNHHVIVGERDSFKSYIYCGSGPSSSYTHHNRNVSDLLT